MGMGDQSHESATLRPGKKAGIHGYRRLGGPQDRSGTGAMQKIWPPPPGIDPRTVHSIASCYTDDSHHCPVYCIKYAINWNTSYLSKWISYHLRNFPCFETSFHIQYFIFRTLHLPCKNINDSVRQKFIPVCSSSSI
jgi:hypothetical protein